MEKLKFRQIAAYGFGDIALNLFFTGLNLYLLYYYTDVVGLSPAIAGLIISSALIWDAITDPVMGWIASRTRTRFGRYRPYLLFGTPFMALSFVLIFAAPLLLPGAVVFACVLSNLLFRTLYTVVAIPYAAMTAALTSDTNERGYLAGARMFAAIVGGLLVAALTQTLAIKFGAGDMKIGFMKVAMLFAALSTIIMWITFFATRERVALPEGQARLTTSDTLNFLRKNKAFWIYFIGVFCSSVGGTIFTKSIIYYVIYNIGQPDAMATTLVVLLLMVGLSIPIWTFISKYLEKRTVWLIGASISVCLLIAMYIVEPSTTGELYGLLAGYGLMAGATAVTLWSMVPDTVEFGQWHSGVRDEGIVFALVQLALKAASSLGVGLVGFTLALIGYVANQAQSPETLQGLRMITFLGPVAGIVLMMVAIWFYPITKTHHRDLVAKIAERDGVA